MSKKLHIAALGSSFAAGPGIAPLSNAPAGRSSKNYASLLASRLDARLTDLTVSGATLLNVLSEPQQTAMPGQSTEITFAPQLDQLPGDLDIVTLTAGGNDMGYVGGIMGDEVRAAEWAQGLIPLPDAPPEAPGAEEVKERFVAVIDRIREIAPTARILLVEYLTLLGDDVAIGKGVPFREDRIKHHRNVAETLRDANRHAAQARDGVEVVEIARLSQTHGLGSSDPWVEGLSYELLMGGKVPFHPNAEGMEAVAEALYEKLKDFATVKSKA